MISGITFGSLGRQIAKAMHCTLRVGLGTLSAIASLSGRASAAEPPRGADNLVRAVKVLPDKAPDSSSLKAIVETVTRDCKCNDDKMIALNNFMRISHYHRAYPPGGPSLLWFNNYGWSLCGGLAGLQMSAVQPDSRLELARRAACRATTCRRRNTTAPGTGSTVSPSSTRGGRTRMRPRQDHRLSRRHQGGSETRHRSAGVR